MKLFVNLLLGVFFILAVVKTSDAQVFSVSGKVRYADNNEIVTSGSVKLYSTIGVLLASCPIQPEGDYIIAAMYATTGDLIGFPNVGNELDFVATGYPNQINPSQFTHITVNGNMQGYDIYVQRNGGEMPFINTAKVSGIVLNSDNKPVSDAIVYIQKGASYYGFGVTDSKGGFKIQNAPTGDYILVAHKIGSQSEYINVTISEDGLRNIEFNLNSKTGAETNEPVSFALSQNYPNPFNPSTVISYTLPKEGIASLKVFNAIGQQVADLVNTYQNAGAHIVEFNAQNLSSGIYYYRLESNGFADTKKMILVK